MKIGLYFGSFNPIHIGHLIIANHALEMTDLDKIWFIVSPQNPLKPSASLLNEYDRLHLVQLAIEDNDKFRASNIEFSLPRPSYTVDTLAYLYEKFPLEEFSVILGSDSYENLPRWKNWEALLRHCRFVVYQRPGHPPPHYPDADALILDAPVLDISATFLRKEIKAGRSVRYMVPPAAYAHILENRYYRN